MSNYADIAVSCYRQDNNLYNLFAISNHIGSSYGAGHYTAYCKHPYSNIWHSYNDSIVSVIPLSSLSSTLVTPEAYVLFYIRSTDDDQ